VKGRASIPSLCSGAFGRSLEGLEVLMMYGYKPKPLDIECICWEVFRSRTDDELTYRLKVLHFCLVTAGSKKLATIDFEGYLNDATYYPHNMQSCVARARGVVLAQQCSLDDVCASPVNDR
jgi:hypothetical protein